MNDIFTLKLELVGSKPKIWREIKINSELYFSDLHDIIQVLMDWENCHVHDFTIDSRACVIMKGYDEVFHDCAVYIENDTRLEDLLWQKKQSIIYNYDFGDNWEVKITVEKIEPKQPDDCNVVCLKGARHGTPDDCGGIPGYEHLIEIAKDKTHPEYEDMIVGWLGEDFDPEYFDLTESNKKLACFNETKKRSARRKVKKTWQKCSIN